MSNIKSPEEILELHCPLIVFGGHRHSLLKAMESYAYQFKHPILNTGELREKMLEAIEDNCNGICLSKKSVSDSVDKAADLCTSIAEEYAQQNKWIDVNVELPYMGQLVIVYQDYGDNSSYSVIEWNKSEEKYYKLNNIKIWQPLPTPPQSQNK